MLKTATSYTYYFSGLPGGEAIVLANFYKGDGACNNVLIDIVKPASSTVYGTVFSKTGSGSVQAQGDFAFIPVINGQYRLQRNTESANNDCTFIITSFAYLA